MTSMVRNIIILIYIYGCNIQLCNLICNGILDSFCLYIIYYALTHLSIHPSMHPPIYPLIHIQPSFINPSIHKNTSIHPYTYTHIATQTRTCNTHIQTFIHTLLKTLTHFDLFYGCAHILELELELRSNWNWKWRCLVEIETHCLIL